VIAGSELHSRSCPSASPKAVAVPARRRPLLRHVNHYLTRTYGWGRTRGREAGEGVPMGKCRHFGNCRNGVTSADGKFVFLSCAGTEQSRSREGETHWYESCIPVDWTGRELLEHIGLKGVRSARRTRTMSAPPSVRHGGRVRGCNIKRQGSLSSPRYAAPEDGRGGNPTLLAWSPAPRRWPRSDAFLEATWDSVDGPSWRDRSASRPGR
jgi:hypothetical protein